MTTRRSGRRDPLETAIEIALQPGRFIAHRAGWGFVSSLEEVAGQLEALTRTDAQRAVGLYETFVAGCYEKAEELHDSSGTFSMFVVSLHCGWIRARQAANAEADETARLLLGRMENDPYGFASGIERDAVKVMSRDGLAAFDRQVRARFEAKDAVEQASDHAPRRDPAYLRRRWGEILRAIYTRRRDVRAYVALCEQTHLSAQDCLAVAIMLKTRRKWDEALAWVDRGLALEKQRPHDSMAGHDLVTLRRELLTKLGRHRDALEDAWAAFRQNPSTFSYGDLMRFVPKAERAAWHTKAMDTAERADPGSLVELWLETREVERLVRWLRTATDPEIEELSHHRTEPAASRLAKSYPDVAAKVYRALGVRILSAKKSRYYDAALSHFENAKRCYERSDLHREWAALVADVRRAHHRKAGFMAGFERLAAGHGPSDAPSFLDRARSRWSARPES
jgi:tetratricopeptide (TPR) repeat protein